MFCSRCGKEIADQALMCPNCGTPTQSSDTPGGAQYNNGAQYGYNGGQYNQYNGSPYYGNQYNPAYDQANTGLVILSVIFPIVGIALYFANKNTQPKAASTYLKTALITWGVCFVIGFIIGFLGG